MPDILEIPIDNDDDSPALKMRTVLEGVEFLLEFKWNTRDLRWNISFLSSQDDPILMGIPLNINSELLERFEIDELPPGKMILFDSTGKTNEAGLSDLGARCKLLYQNSV